MTESRFKNVFHELQHHFPFSILASILALIAMAMYTELLAPMVEAAPHDHAGHGSTLTDLFHVFHPAHVFLSAAATSAMFWRYDRRWGMAVCAGLGGGLVVCGLSDIIFPFAGGLLLGVDMTFHLCLGEHPLTSVSFALMGLASGIFAASGLNTPAVSKAAHAMHVLISTGATILYLVGFGLMDWTSQLGPVFVVVTLSVIIPCCASDIVFPLLLVNKKGVHWCLGECESEDGHHDHDHS